MSIDFGGSFSGRVSKETMIQFPGIENIIFRNESWSDNKCGLIDGYHRESVSFETETRFYNYVLDNSLFSGFVNSSRVDVADKKDSSKRSYKLAAKATTRDYGMFHKINDGWTLLSEWNYERLENDSFEPVFEDDEVSIPKVWIPRHYDPDRENIFLVESTINNVDSYIIFRMDRNGLNDIGYYNTESGDLEMYALSDVADEEYLSAYQNADAALSKPYDSEKYKQLYFFSTKIFLDFQSVKDPSANSNAQSDDIEADECQPPKEDLSNLTMPVIPRLPLADYKDGTLTFNGPYDHISPYLVRLTLHSLGITSDEDLNNYYYCDDKLMKMKLKLVIPGSVRVIDNGAFMNKQFETVVIEDGVTKIGEKSFYNVQAKSITLPETLTEIGKKAFAENRISAIFIPKNVCSIPGDAFCRCNLLNWISVDKDNEYYRRASDHKVLIEKSASRLVIALEKAVIPEDVIIIGAGSFSWLRDTGELIIPNGVEIIEDDAFSSCSYTNVIFPDTLLEIGKGTFRQFRCLKKLIFPKNLKRIGEDSFRYIRLEEVDISPNTVIEEGCFDSICEGHSKTSNEI